MKPEAISTESRLPELAELIERFTVRDGTYKTAIAPLCLYRSSTTTELAHDIYEPMLCIIAQGSKQVLLGEETYIYDTTRFLLASVHLPVSGQVVGATPKTPYLSLSLALDPGQISTLMLEADLPAPQQSSPMRGIAVDSIDATLFDSLLRLLRLLENPEDIRILAPMVTREILYRLLQGGQGERLRQIASDNGQTHRVVQAIQWLKQNYRQPFRIEDIAREVYMSPSGLHAHFKAVTAMSPLQYQKQLRLQEARRLMLGEALDVTSASYQVGYASPSQFTREYSRLFGAPPLRDIARLRNDPILIRQGREG